MKTAYAATLAVSILILVPECWVANAGSVEHAEQLFKALGGRVRRDQSEKHIVAVTFVKPRITSEAIDQIAKLESLQELHFYETKVSAAELTQLRGLKKLRTLTLAGPDVTDAEVKTLCEFDQLEVLHLSPRRVSDAAIAELKKLTHLQKLTMNGVSPGASTLQHLRHIKTVELLLYDFPVVHIDFAEMRGFANLRLVGMNRKDITDQLLKTMRENGLLNAMVYFYESQGILDLSDSQITDAGLQQLQGLRGFETLNVFRTNITDVGLKHLSDLRDLRSLSLQETKVTDAGLKWLRELKGLQSLCVFETRVTDIGVRDLLVSLPNLKVIGERKRLGFDLRKPQRAILPATADRLRCLAFSPDGKTLALGGEDSTVKLWDVAANKVIRVMTGHKSPVRAMTFTKHGVLVSSSADTVIMWNADGPKYKTGFDDRLHPFALSPDGKYVAHPSPFGFSPVTIVDTATGKQKVSLQLPASAACSCIAFSRSGALIAIATEGKGSEVVVWDVAAAKRKATFRADDTVSAVAFSMDEKSISIASYFKSVKHWDLTTGKENAQFEVAGVIHTLVFSPDGARLAAAAESGDISIWDIAARSQVAVLEGHVTSYRIPFIKYASVLQFSADGQQLAALGYDQTIRLWDLPTKKNRIQFASHTNHISSLAFSPDGKSLASGSEDCTVRLWDVATGKSTAVLQDSATAWSLAFSPDGKLLAAGGGGPVGPGRSAAIVWNVQDGTEKARFSCPSRQNLCVAFRPDGKVLAIGDIQPSARGVPSLTGRVRFWDRSTGKVEEGLQMQYGPVWRLAYSPDGKTLAGTSGIVDQIVNFWDLTTGKELHPKQSWQRIGNCPVFSSDGKLLAVTSEVVRIYETATGEEKAALSDHEEAVMAVAFSPDGKILASASVDETVRLWDVEKEKQLAILLGHKDGVLSVAFSPDGRTLASGGRDNTILFWQVIKDDR